jgi:hypothetical protein
MTFPRLIRWRVMWWHLFAMKTQHATSTGISNAANFAIVRSPAMLS